MASPDAFAQSLHASGSPCESDDEKLGQYHPDPKSSVKGVTDTSPLSCKYGTNGGWGVNSLGPAVCGWKPHFNWVVSTCEEGAGATTGSFCADLPPDVRAQGAKINYVAAYQFDGDQFNLVDESSVGDLTDAGIAGSYAEKTGWERAKKDFSWVGGDWTTKYAPWTREGVKGTDGPRGLTPPASLWILSAENFYYGALYMLPQMTLNLQGQHNQDPSWTWELDPVEGTAGWTPGKGTTGNLNMLYATNNAQQTPCMPVAWTNSLANGNKPEFRCPAEFAAYCAQNASAVGCDLTGEGIWWSGGHPSSNRFENNWDEPYVFAVVIDQLGYWTYRWRPDKESGGTGWPGVGQHQAARVLPARPAPVQNPEGLKTDVAGSVAEAVILMPSLPPESACLRASCEDVKSVVFAGSALGAMAEELGESGPGGKYDGAQNWWAHYADTKQFVQDYPLSIAGVPASMLFTDYECNTVGTFGGNCSTGRSSGPAPSWPSGGGSTGKHHHNTALIVGIVAAILIVGLLSGLAVLYWFRLPARTPSFVVGWFARSSAAATQEPSLLAQSGGDLPLQTRLNVLQDPIAPAQEGEEFPMQTGQNILQAEPVHPQ